MTTIIGNGKTFLGALLLVLAAALNSFGALPAGVHVDVSLPTALSTALIAIGLGAKLQTLIGLLSAKS